jgi:hypothetical protein
MRGNSSESNSSSSAPWEEKDDQQQQEKEQQQQEKDGDPPLPAAAEPTALVTLALSFVASTALTATIVCVAAANKNDTAMTVMTLGLVCGGCYLLWTAKYVTFV